MPLDQQARFFSLISLQQPHLRSKRISVTTLHLFLENCRVFICIKTPLTSDDLVELLHTHLLHALHLTTNFFHVNIHVNRNLESKVYPEKCFKTNVQQTTSCMSKNCIKLSFETQKNEGYSEKLQLPFSYVMFG